MRLECVTIDNVNKGDKHMNFILKRQNKLNLTHVKLHKSSYSNIKFSANLADKLIKDKTIPKCKNGVIQLDSSHPNYNF